MRDSIRSDKKQIKEELTVGSADVLGPMVQEQSGGGCGQDEMALDAAAASAIEQKQKVVSKIKTVSKDAVASYYRKAASKIVKPETATATKSSKHLSKIDHQKRLKERYLRRCAARDQEALVAQSSTEEDFATATLREALDEANQIKEGFYDSYQTGHHIMFQEINQPKSVDVHQQDIAFFDSRNPTKSENLIIAQDFRTFGKQPTHNGSEN